jgi:UDP-N-acetylglucosamine--N-acetylmuramyl-(pentapeptide) pyrophosphoryl-undecaprenol N-acetylglucosamine transferase
MSEMSPIDLLWIGTGRPVERDTLSGRPWQYRVLEVKPLLGVSGAGAVKSLVSLPYYIVRAWSWLKAFKPDVVFGVGGYVSGPVLLAARLLGIPTVLHEQNLVPGLTNRIASRFVDVVLLSFEGAVSSFAVKKVVVTGNPVRISLIADYRQESRPEGGQLRLLIIGGSQGARGLNRLACSAIGLLSKSGVSIDVIHQTGQADLDLVRSLYDEAKVPARVYPFINNMAEAYSWADLVICRAGAGTLAELTALGKPSILIPYPAAAGGHQDANAKALAEAGGAIYFCEEDIGAVKMASEIQALLEDPLRLKDMGAKAKLLGRPDAARVIASVLLKIAGFDTVL